MKKLRNSLLLKKHRFKKKKVELKMRILKIIEDLGVDPVIKETSEPGTLQEDVEQVEQDGDTKKEQKDSVGD